MFEIGTYVACIAEGTAEQIIIELLLDQHLLIFEREKLIEEKVLRCRGANAFENRYLRKEYKGKITVFRILDSRREKFKLSKMYQDKVDVINIITAPEIEMLIILSEDRFKDYKKSNMKPSEFCIKVLKYREVKSKEFVKKYFSDTDFLVAAIKKYVSVSNIRKGEKTLLDLLRTA